LSEYVIIINVRNKREVCIMSTKVFINETDYITITEHQGKMTLIPSISTNKKLNEQCMRMSCSENPDCICTHCYVDKTMAMYPRLEVSLTNNTEVLTKRELTTSEIKAIANQFLNVSIVRFESFGDLNNETQLLNYIRLARAARHTRFALFTKQYQIVKKYFESGKRFPDNVTLILSSPYIDHVLHESFVNEFKQYHRRVITFTVTRDKANPNINCGKRKCVECRNCYDAKTPKNVIEYIK
jgi:hypothetical protein